MTDDEIMSICVSYVCAEWKRMGVAQLSDEFVREVERQKRTLTEAIRILSEAGYEIRRKTP